MRIVMDTNVLVSALWFANNKLTHKPSTIPLIDEDDRCFYDVLQLIKK